MVLQQTVLAAEVAVAKGAVTHDALSGLSAVLGGATELLSRHDGRESESEKARMKAKKDGEDLVGRLVMTLLSCDAVPSQGVFCRGWQASDWGGRTPWD